MFIKFLSALILIGASLSAQPISLKEKMSQAKPGSYLVLEQNKNFTLLNIHAASAGRIVIEEVSIPLANFAKDKMKWKEWFEKGAPGHTSWIMSQVNLNSGALEETYSYTHRGWINLSQSDPFFTTLLNLSFEPVTDKERRRIGLPPGYNKVDRRPFWNPRLIADGKMISDTSFIAYKTRWPGDGSELSHKNVEIYLPQPKESAEGQPLFPIYFPYWLEVEGKYGSAKIRVVDSGFDARSPKGEMPKRPPKLSGEPKLSEEGLTFNLNSPPYFKEFLVFAEERGSFFGGTIPLPCQIIDEQTGSISLFVSKEALKILEGEGAVFSFMITPKESSVAAIHTQSLTFNPNYFK